MRQQYPKSIAWRIELHNSYFVQIITKKALSERLGLRIDNPIQNHFAVPEWIGGF